jgi:thiosulfate/3-mercaptopyruvate sulfurtransferase
MASNTWFVLKYVLEYPNVRLYEGSWDEWNNLGYQTE